MTSASKISGCDNKINSFLFLLGIPFILPVKPQTKMSLVKINIVINLLRKEPFLIL